MPNGLKVVSMTESDISSVLSLADESVGKNLYTRQDFENALIDKNSFVYVLKSDSGEIAGYVFFFITTTVDIAQKCGLDEALFSSVSPSVCGRIQSAAVKKEYRGRGLSVVLMKYAVDMLRSKGIDTAFAVCWKPGGIVSIKKTLNILSFSFLKEVEKMWWNNTNLYCPYCHGRCSCSAEIYYKKLKGEGQ